MSLPIIFGNLPPNSQQPASLLDENFAALAALTTVPCTCVTTGGLLTLTPLASAPTIGGALVAQQSFGAVADATPSGAMTATIPNTSNGQSKKVFIDGVQASSRVAAGDYFVLVFDPALDSGNGGFFLIPTTAPVQVPPRIVTASDPIIVGATDLLILIDQTSPAALTITLPDPATKVGPVIIKDWAGVAGTHNFTVSGATIDGQSSFVMNDNFQSLGLCPVPGLGYAIYDSLVFAASQAAAEAGADNTGLMTPLRTAQSVAAYGKITFATVADAEASALPGGLSLTAFETRGYAIEGDGGGARYEIVDTDPGAGGLALTAPAKFAKLTNENVDIRKFGAKGDGVTDCDTAFADSQEWIANEIAAGRLGQPIPLAPGDTYVVNESVVVTNYGGFIGPRQARIYAPAASFTNTSRSTFDATNAVVISVSGVKAGGTAIVGAQLKGFTIQQQTGDGRFITAIQAQNGENIRIEDIEIFGGCSGYGINAGSLTHGSRIVRCYLHDFSTNATSMPDSVTAQITAIELDDDQYNGASDGVLIAENDIYDMLFGSDAEAAYGYQTDGINIGSYTALNTRILGNHMERVGEAIDNFGSFSKIANNTAVDATSAGVKLIHGAQHCDVSHNTIVRPGLVGIIVDGANDQDTAYNKIRGNDIINVNQTTGRVGYWTGKSTTSCINTDGGIDGAKVAHDNLFDGNNLTPGANCDYAVVRDCFGGHDNDVVRTKIYGTGTSGLLHDVDGDGGLFETIPATIVRAYNNTATLSFAAGTLTTVVFDTAEFDTKSEYSTTTGKFTAAEPGYYRFRAQVRCDMPDGVALGIFLRVADNIVAVGNQFGATGDTQEGTVPETGTTYFLAAGDTAYVQVRNNDSSSHTATNGVQYCFLSIERQHG